MKATKSESVHDGNIKDVNPIKLLMAWWDFMGIDQTADRREYSHDEQFKLIHQFLTNVPFELVKYKQEE